MRKLSVVIPVYNEQATINNFIAKLKEEIGKNNSIFECIFVDDSSDDKTQDILRDNNVNLLSHSRRLGYGAALKTGIEKAQGDFICIIDADNTYSPSDILRLAQFTDDFDMIVGARVKCAEDLFPFYQNWAKGFICFLLKIIFKQKIIDINSGLRLIKKTALKKYLSILPDGFSFTASITLAMLIDKHKIKYIPVNYFRRLGRSKVEVLSYTINFIKSYWRIIYCLR